MQFRYQGCTQYSQIPGVYTVKFRTRGVHNTVQIPGVYTVQFRYQGCTQYSSDTRGVHMSTKKPLLSIYLYSLPKPLLSVYLLPT